MPQNVPSLPLSATYGSPPASLTYRSRLASLISPLRRVIPRVPFWQLRAHRVPVLWGLYRGLLRVAPTDEIKCKVKSQFRDNRHLTSPAKTKEKMLVAYRLLDVCKEAKQGHERSQLLLQRYSRMLTAKKEKDEWIKILLEAKAHMQWLRNRPIITGYFRPTHFNRPMPRLKPQPTHIGSMIARRRLQRDRRNALYADLKEWRMLIREEAAFEEDLLERLRQVNQKIGFGKKSARTQTFQPVFIDEKEQWEYPITSAQWHIKETFALDSERILTPFSPELLERIKAAKRERVANKTRERQREARGEVLRITIKRANKGLPAWVSSVMSEKRIRMDKISRSSVSEVGYIGHIKKRLGWKLKNEDPWAAEDGQPEMQEELDRKVREVIAENRRRRRKARTTGNNTNTGKDVLASAPSKLI